MLRRICSQTWGLRPCDTCMKASEGGVDSLKVQMERTLSTLALDASPPFPEKTAPMKLNDLRDNPGARKQRKRVGRGIGSGLGKTAGRGHGGQKSRSGGKPRLGFEGGQTPMRLRLPRVGVHNPFSFEYSYVNLSQLQSWIDQGRIDADKLITMKTLRDSGAVSKHVKDGVKLLGGGSEDFTAKVNLEVSKVSAKAREAIEKAGGTVHAVYYNKLGLRALLKPDKFSVMPRPARPPPKLRPKFQYVGRLPEPTEVLTE